MAKTRITLIILSVLVLFGLYVRTSGTLQGYFAFTFDHARDFVDLRQMLDEGKLRLIGPPTGIDGVFHGVWWHWLLIPFFIATGGDPKLMVLIFNIISTGEILLAYYLGKKINGRTGGLIFAALVATSPFFISTSAQLWHPHVIPLLTFIYGFVLLKLFKTKNSFIALGFLLGIFFEFGFLAGGIVVAASIVALWLNNLRPNIKQLLLSIGGFLLWEMPRGIFELRHNFIQTRSFIAYLTNSQRVIDPLSLRFMERMKTIYGLFSDAFFGTYQAWAGAFLVILIVLLVRLFPLFSHTEKKLVKYLLTLLAAMTALAIIYPNTIWHYYLISISGFMLPIVGLVITHLIKKNKVVGSLLLFSILLINVSPWRFFAPAWEGDAAVYKNQRAVVDAIYTRAQGGQFNVAVYSPSLTDYNYQYLFNWYGMRKYGYIPDSQKPLPVTFYIIEPDPWNKGLREKWLQERQTDGEIVWQETLPGKIELQHRQRNLE